MTTKPTTGRYAAEPDGTAEDAPPPAPAPALTLDLSTLTLGEMAEVERQSRRSFEELLTAGRASRRLAAMFVAEWRNSGAVPSWQELSSRHL
jgi:hypothetical protein